MGRIIRAIIVVVILLLLDFVLVCFGSNFVINPLPIVLIFLCVDCLFSVLSRCTDVIVVKSKGLLVKRFNQYAVVKSSDGCVFANRKDWPIKFGTKDVDLKVGCKYRIVSYMEFGHKERNILVAYEIKFSGRKKLRKKLK